MPLSLAETKDAFDKIVKRRMREGLNRRDATKLSIIANRPFFDQLTESGETYPHQDVALTLPERIVGELVIPDGMSEDVQSRKSAIDAFESAVADVCRSRKVSQLSASLVVGREQPELRVAYDTACN